MTEAEWLACEDPEFLWPGLSRLAPPSSNPSRKEHLLAVAFCRRIKGLLIEPETLETLDVIEAFADGRATAAELRRAADGAVPNWDEFEFTNAFTPAQRAAVETVIHAASAPAAWLVPGTLRNAIAAVEFRGTAATVVPDLADLIREVMGNPFRPVAFDPAWRSDTAVSLARGMYDSRDFSPMPILADALQDAGCENEDVLNHCRDEKQVHVRGCWVVDLVLGKA